MVNFGNSGGECGDGNAGFRLCVVWGASELQIIAYILVFLVFYFFWNFCEFGIFLKIIGYS